MQRTIADLAREFDAKILGRGDLAVNGVASPEQAGPGSVVFVESKRYLKAALASNAGCLVVPPSLDIGDRDGLQTATPKLLFCRIARLLHPPTSPDPGVDAHASVDSTAQVGEHVSIGRGAVVGAGAEIGDRVTLGAGAVLGAGVRVGADSQLLARVVVYDHVSIGERVLAHAGCVLGADGFGFVPGPDGLEKFPQIGGLIIEDDVELGANTTIDRGALGDTLIGRGTKIDNLVQIAHNVRIGHHCAISAQVGIAGSTVLEDRVTLGGQVGIGDHVHVESGAIIAGQAGIASRKRIRAGVILWGTPARPLDEIKRQQATLGCLGNIKRELDELRQLRDRLDATLDD